MVSDKKIQGKNNRARGKRFELKVREDLEKKGWIVDRWTNNIDLGFRKDEPSVVTHRPAKLVPCRPSFNPFTKSMIMNSGGLPDFIAFQYKPNSLNGLYEVNGIECKGGNDNHKYLDSKEKEKCQWLLGNKIFSKILIAQRGKKRGEIIYTEFK